MFQRGGGDGNPLLFFHKGRAGDGGCRRDYGGGYAAFFLPCDV